MLKCFCVISDGKKMRVCQLAEIDPAESVLHFTKFEIASLRAKSL